jgi:mannose-6-phosphate isomerase-like protein (cupin superfamily)
MQDHEVVEAGAPPPLDPLPDGGNLGVVTTQPNPPPCNTGDRRPAVLHREDWASHPELWKGSFEDGALGTGVTVLFYVTDEVGEGPRWHVHPYDEVFIVRAGHALFTIGNEKLEATAGDIVMGPANVPHKYHNLGPGRLETTDIHVSERWIQTNLEDPELSGG